MSSFRVAVVGANGFVGRAVVEDLVSNGYDVTAVVRPDSLSTAATRTAVVPDPSNSEALAPALRGIDAVVNTAGRAHVLDERAPDPLAAFRAVNVELARGIARAASVVGASLYVELSSVAAVGERSRTPLTSSTPPAPVTPYGVSKLEAENAAEETLDGPRLIVLRPPMVYGPHMRGNPLRLFEFVYRGAPLPFGALENRRSMIFVGNLAAAVRAAVASRSNAGRYFVADPQPVSTAHFVRSAAEALGTSTRLHAVPLWMLRMGGLAGDVINRLRRFPLTSAAIERLSSSLVLDTSAFATDFAFEPPFTFDQGMHRTAEWFRSRESRAVT